MYELGSTKRETTYKEKEAFHSRICQVAADGDEKTENRRGFSIYWARRAKNGQKLRGRGNEGVCLLQEDESATRSGAQKISQSPSKDS